MYSPKNRCNLMRRTLPFEGSFRYRYPRNLSANWYDFHFHRNIVIRHDWQDDARNHVMRPGVSFLVSGQPIEPIDIVCKIRGWMVSASTLSTTSTQTVPFRHRVPDTGCFLVPQHRSVPVSRTGFLLFFHWPPGYVSSTSKVPEKVQTCFFPFFTQ